MKLILVTLVACAFAAQDTTPPVISLTLPAAAGKISANDASAGADASGDTHSFHNHGVKDYSSSAATECTAGASYATCAEPSCEAHDHHDQSVECNKPKKYLIKQHADGRNEEQYTLVKDEFKEYQTCTHKASGLVATQCISDVERKYLAQWLLVYTASDDSGNAADQVTFSFVFVDLFAPELTFGSDNGLQYGVGFENYQVWGDVKQRFEGNLKNNIESGAFASYASDGNKEFTRLCAIETDCSDAVTSSAWTSPSSEKPINKAKEFSQVERDYGLALVAGNQDVDRYGAISDGYQGDYTTGGDRASTHCMYTMTPGITINDEEKYNTNPVKYRIDGTGEWEDVPANFEINTLETGDEHTVTVDFHIEDNAGRFGYKSKNNQNLHRVEFIFTDAIAPKIYLKGYNSQFSLNNGANHGGSTHTYNYDGVKKYGKQTTTDNLVATAQIDANDGTVDICKDSASTSTTECPYTTQTAVTLECGRDYTMATETKPLLDGYVEAGAYVIDNVDGWGTDNKYTPQSSAESTTLDGGSTISISGTVNTETPDDYTITYTATDSNGLDAAPKTRVVTVADRIAPRLKITGDHTIQNSAGSNKVDANTHDKDYETGECDEEGDIEGCFAHDLYKTGYTCVDQCDQTPSVKTQLYKFDADTTETSGCDADGQLVNTASNPTQEGTDDDWTFPEYETGLYAILYTCTDAAGNSATACRTIKNVDHTQPIIQILGSDTMQLEATHQGNYIDDGATCSDQVDGVISQNVEVSGDVVNLSKVGTYRITYNCKDAANRAAETAERVVTVAQTSCPTCDMVCATTLNSEVTGDQTVVSCEQQHEASFQYTDAGAACSDVIDGATDHTCTLSFEAGTEGKEDSSRPEVAEVTGTNVSCDGQLVNADRIGTYVITYRSVNSVGKANDDTTCRGGYYNYIRSVQVVDTLKPVITLKYGSDIVAQGPVDDTTPKGTTEGSINAAGTNHGGAHKGTVNTPRSGIAGQAAFSEQTLMAEDATTSGVNGWVLGAIASAVTGLALLGYSQRKTTVATSVPV